MRKSLFPFCLIVVAQILCAQSHQLRRSESFFGFHFDFHATAKDKEIGKTLTAGMIDSLLAMTHPDYIQVDCKGHAGFSSYPTTIGNRAGGYTQDILKLFREVTARHNVALYVHYSGVWDQRAIAVHPGWGIGRPDGTRDSLKTSFYSGYLDSLLIPQLKELADVYHVSGAWVDGDCWAAEPDYSPSTLRNFSAETGITIIPKSPGDLHYKEFLEFNRTLFRRHAAKYVDAIHRENPAFEITSNWAFSSLMPEPVTINVDFLSGDVAGQNCLNNAAFQARCLALQGKPWDLMAWSFAYAQPDVFFVPKSLPQLKQEAAEVMAMGGGFQSYWTQNRDGSLKSWNFPQMSKLAEFCRARQPYCQGSEPVADIAVWYSVNSWKKSFDGMYAGGTGPMEGILTLLLDGQHCVDVLMDHQIVPRIDRYKLLVIPEWTDLDSTLKRVVLQYVEKGGAVLAIGAGAAREFEPFLGVTFQGEPKTIPIYIGYPDDLSGIKSAWQPVLPKSGTETVGSCFSICDSRYPTGNPAGTIVPMGKGKLGALYIDLGVPYCSTQSPTYRKLVNDIVSRLVNQPTLNVTGSEFLHLVLSKKGGNTYVHLINTGGSHFNKRVFTYEEVPPLGPLTIRLCRERNPSSVVLRPEGKALHYRFQDGMVTIDVPRLDIYSIIEVIP
jgi:hypothetical protein